MKLLREPDDFILVQARGTNVEIIGCFFLISFKSRSLNEIILK